MKTNFNLLSRTLSPLLALSCLGYATSLQAQVAPRVINLTVSLHNERAGDDDGTTQDVDAGSAEQDRMEKMWQFAADAIWEMSEGRHTLGKITIYEKGKRQADADVIWNASGHPNANAGGISSATKKLNMFDVFAGGGGGGANLNFDNDLRGAGYTIAHELGHYYYGMLDEYCRWDSVNNKWVNIAAADRSSPSVMSSQWNARNGNWDWLNFSIANDGVAPMGPFEVGPQTAQVQFLNGGAWEVLVRAPASDPQSYKDMFGNRPFYNDLAAPAATPTRDLDAAGAQAAARANLEVVWAGDDSTVVVVIDRSGSMSGTPISNARTAAQILTDTLELGSTRLGLVTFASSATTDQAIIDLATEGDRTTVKGVISGINASGGTSIHEGASRALSMLQADNENSSEVVFLLSDGQSDRAAALAVANQYAAADIPIFTFAYGSGADAALLQDMAQITGGRFYQSPTTLAAITAAFNDARVTSTSTVGIASGSAQVAAGATVTETVNLVGAMSNLTFTGSYLGADGDLQITITLPDSSTAQPQKQSAGNDVVWLLNLENPAEGTYTIAYTSSAAAAIDTDFSASGTPEGQTFTPVLAPQNADDFQYNYPEPIVIETALFNGYPVVDAELTASISYPSGAMASVVFNDNGQNADRMAGDGIYTAQIVPLEDGVVVLSVSYDNDGNTAEYLQESGAPSATEDGDLPAELPNMPVATNFRRTASVQLNVSGYQGNTGAVVNVTPDITATFNPAAWQLDRTTGLLMGTVSLTNNTAKNSTPLVAPFWISTETTADVRVGVIDGQTPDSAFDYMDISEAMNQALTAVGNQDMAWDPGETVTVPALPFYSRTRTAPDVDIFAVYADPPADRLAAHAYSFKNGWFHLHWIGTYYGVYYPWLYVDKVGWFFITGDVEDLWLYHQKDGTWYYAAQDTDSWYFNWSKQQWVHQSTLVQP